MADWPEYLATFGRVCEAPVSYRDLSHALAAMAGTRFDSTGNIPDPDTRSVIACFVAACPDRRVLFEALDLLRHGWIAQPAGASLRDDWLVNAKAVEALREQGIALTDEVYTSIVTGEAGL